MSGRYCQENKLRSKTTLPYIRQKNISFLSITLDFVNLWLDFGFLYFHHTKALLLLLFYYNLTEINNHAIKHSLLNV